jgi:hypothetical protein
MIGPLISLRKIYYHSLSQLASPALARCHPPGERVNEQPVELDLLLLARLPAQQELLAGHALPPEEEQHPQRLQFLLLPLLPLLSADLVAHQLPVHLRVDLAELSGDQRQHLVEEADAAAVGTEGERGAGRRLVRDGPLLLLDEDGLVLGRGEVVVLSSDPPVLKPASQRDSVELGRLVVLPVL